MILLFSSFLIAIIRNSVSAHKYRFAYFW